MMEPIRLNKYLSNSGVSTRREAVDIIKKGFASVNDVKCLDPFYEVKPEDVIKFKDKIVVPKVDYVYLLINKPTKYYFNTAEGDEEKSRLISNLYKNHTQKPLKQVFPLSDDSCGLTLLTDDEILVEKYTAPSKKVIHIFEFHTKMPLNMEEIHPIKDSFMKLNDISTFEIIEKEACVYELKTTRGDDHIIYQFFVNLKLTPSKIDRLVIGNMTKKDLKRGWFRILEEKELIFLKHF